MSLPPLPPIAFRQAIHFTPFAPFPRNIALIVLHTIESSELDLTAENMAAGISNPATTWRASWHYAVDRNSIVQSVRDRDVAWAAPGANANGLQIELAGRARQNAAEWDDPYSRSTLLLAANLVAHKCVEHVIPARFVDFVTLRAGAPFARGITSHAAVSLAFGKSTHTDPGRDFPWSWFIETVGALLRGAEDKP